MTKPAGPAPSLRPIVLVDDEPYASAILRRLLEQGGTRNLLIHYRDVDTAEAFLGAIDEKTNLSYVPCLLLIDLHMPARDGFDLLSWVRARPLFRLARVMALSGSEAPGDRERALASGAEGYLAKYPDAGQLRVLVDEAQASKERSRANVA